MNNSIKQQKDTSLPLKEITGGNVKLILPADVLASITYMHSLYGSNEWSGVLLYERTSGKDITDFIFKVKAIYPLALGTTAFVEGGQGRGEMDIMQMYDDVPDSMNLRSGFIHTHHNMTTFFSTTDCDELTDNTEGYDCYLSLIVNFSGQYTARLAFVGETEERRVFFKGTSGQQSFITTPKEKCIYYTDVDIDFEVPAFVDKRFGLLLEEEVKKRTAVKANQQQFQRPMGFQPNQGHQQDMFDWRNEYPGYMDQRIDKQIEKSPNTIPVIGAVSFDKIGLKSFILKWLTLDFNYEENFEKFKLILKKNAVDDQSFYMDLLEEALPDHLMSSFLANSVEEIDATLLSDFCEQAIEVMEENLFDWAECEQVCCFLNEYMLEETISK